jgi:hypothetical protein
MTVANGTFFFTQFLLRVMENTSTTKKCAKPWCKKVISNQSSQKHCPDCQQRDRENQKASRARKKCGQALIGDKRARERGPETDERPTQRARVENRENEGHETISKRADHNNRGSILESEDSDADESVSDEQKR